MKNEITNIQDINVLITTISSEIEQGKYKLAQTMEIEKTLSYWNIGRHINNHINYHKDKSNYGQYLFPKLAKSLNVGKRSLYLSFQFYTYYNDINSFSNHLTWTHYKILLTVKSEERRKHYEKILLADNLSTRDLYTLIKKNKDNDDASVGNKLTIFPGILYHYNIKNRDKKYLDLGFHVYSDNYPDKYDFEDSQIIRIIKNKKGYTFKKTDRDSSLLYTYKAKVTKVIDGDTIKVDVDLGFKFVVNQILRLRGINAFEISTKAGIQAKNFILSRLNNLDSIIIKTYNRDKYSRFLADVYLTDNIDDCFLETNNLFLNQQLLDNNLAVKYYIY